jgi:hypothetical protein
MDWQPYFTLDLLELGLLPEGWDEGVVALADGPEREIIIPSEFSPQTEREDWSFETVAGDVLRDRCPWLLLLYLGRLLEFVECSFNRPVFVEKRLRSAMSLHVLSGAGARIDWHAHLHADMLNGLLFVTSADGTGAGDLVFRDADGRQARLAGKAGTFVCFNGERSSIALPRSSRPGRG